MAEFEGPPSKVSKFSLDSQYLENDVMEEGQEEWLSEGILTDDDYNPNQVEQSNSQEESVVSATSMLGDSTMESQASQNEGQVSLQDINIEETLNSLENSRTANQMAELPDDLEAFLIRKTDGTVITAQGSTKKPVEPEPEKQKENSEDDGNDTDELLRMLGEGVKKTKNLKTKRGSGRTKPEMEDDSSDEEDNFVFERRTTRSMKVATTALAKSEPPKAEPEDDDITDCSSDEAQTMTNMFKSNTSVNSNGKSSTTLQPKNVYRVLNTQNVGRISAAGNTEAKTPAKVVKKVVQVVQHPHKAKSETIKPVLKTYKRQSAKVTDTPKSLLKPSIPPSRPSITPSKPLITQTKPTITPTKPASTLVKLSTNLAKPSVTPKPAVAQTKPPVTQLTPSVTQLKPAVNQMKPVTPKQTVTLTKVTPNKAAALQNKVAVKENKRESIVQRVITPPPSHLKKEEQKIMKPEEMDEEVPTDMESNSDADEDSLYDELPSSDSETMDDWFGVDIRAERAADYIALLGNKAHDILTEEKHRVSTKMEELKKSLTELSESGKQQAERLRKATLALAELDAALGAA